MQIFRAQTINKVLGGAFVGPWDVDELPAEWIEALMAIELELPKMQRGKAAVAGAMDAWRKRAGYKQ